MRFLNPIPLLQAARPTLPRRCWMGRGTTHSPAISGLSGASSMKCIQVRCLLHCQPSKHSCHGSVMYSGQMMTMYQNSVKLRTYQLAVCSTLTHSSEAWTLTAAVMRSINGFNSRCLHVITGQDCRHTATAPVFDLLCAICQRRLRYLGPILRMPESRVVRHALMVLTGSGTHYPEGSLLMDC